MTRAATPTCTRTLNVPGARLHYEVRGAGPLVVLVGAPMDATSFAPLADRLATDHTVLTADPRGIHRSPVDDPDQDSTPLMRADDLRRLLTHLDAGPAAVLGSSGGAISALALVQDHPELVHTLVAHEPPLIELLEDRDRLHTQTEDVIATFVAGDVLGAWKKYLAEAGITVPHEVLEQMFGGERDPQTVADERFSFLHMERPTCVWRPDLSALRCATTRISVGLGEDSDGQLCARTSHALTAALGTEQLVFPGGHIGFVEYPDRFADRLRPILRRS